MLVHALQVIGRNCRFLQGPETERQKVCVHPSVLWRQCDWAALTHQLICVAVQPNNPLLWGPAVSAHTSCAWWWLNHQVHKLFVCVCESVYTARPHGRLHGPLLMLLARIMPPLLLLSVCLTHTQNRSWRFGTPFVRTAAARY